MAEGIAPPSEADVRTALELSAESVFVDFKSEFHPNDKGSFLEVLKDIAAMANSGGGIILIGLENDGTANGHDLSECLALDPAKVTDAFYKYTDRQFDNFKLVKLTKNDLIIFAILVGGTQVPLVFSQTGNYADGFGKPKHAFIGGMVYFRHGAKSEAGNCEDLRIFIDRRLSDVRSEWLAGIAKVVEAPSGSAVRIIAPGEIESARPMTLTLDASATLPIGSIDELWPYRQMDVIAKVNKALNGRKNINTAQMLHVRRAHDTNSNPSFCYQQKHTSPKYSKLFVDWVIDQFDKNADFFEEAKAIADAKKTTAELTRHR
jgi:hypothetical protein